MSMEHFAVVHVHSGRHHGLDQIALMEIKQAGVLLLQTRAALSTERLVVTDAVN